MLQLTRKADYGLRLMVEVGSHPGETVGTAEVARRHDIPYEFLRKVVQTLVARGLVVSERGGRGGLYLSRPPEEITVLDIVNAFGIPALNRCTVEPSRCDRRDSCAVYRVWVEAQTAVERVLGRTRLSEVIERQTALTRAGRAGSLARARGGGPR